MGLSKSFYFLLIIVFASSCQRSTNTTSSDHYELLSLSMIEMVGSFHVSTNEMTIEALNNPHFQFLYGQAIVMQNDLVLLNQLSQVIIDGDKFKFNKNLNELAEETGFPFLSYGPIGISRIAPPEMGKELNRFHSHVVFLPAQRSELIRYIKENGYVVRYDSQQVDAGTGTP